MLATKRKFNAILQGLSESAPSQTQSNMNRPTTTANTAGKDKDSDTILMKRRRLGFPPSTAPAIRAATLPSTTSAATPSTQRPRPESRTQSSQESLARYSPGDRAELLKRLATFQEITEWTPKPDKVNEVEWAKRGWVCRGKERVRCVLCHKELVVKLNRKEIDGKETPVLVASDIGDALVAKYSDLLVTAHQDDCLWRKRGCDDTLLRLPLTNAKSSREGLVERYLELCSRSSFLPYEFNIQLPPELDLDRVLQLLPPNLLDGNSPSNGSSSDSHTNRSALALALCGWQGMADSRIGQVPNSASCQTCRRRLGLWMFKSKEVDESGQVIVPAPMGHLDPVREHRFFCPWKNAEAQRRRLPSGGFEDEGPGWKVLLQTISNDAVLRNVHVGLPGGVDRSGTEQAQIQANGETATSVRAEGGDRATTEEDEREQEAKDKERWARLKKVKSLFDIKGGRKSRRPVSRPGTSQSTASTIETGPP